MPADAESATMSKAIFNDMFAKELRFYLSNFRTVMGKSFNFISCFVETDFQNKSEFQKLAEKSEVKINVVTLRL